MNDNTKLSVTNYGPIAEAKDIELCPLTIFVGPSNTGKSYLAILIYALFKSFYAGGRFLPFIFRRRVVHGSIPFNFDVKKNVAKLIKDLSKKDVEEIQFSGLHDQLQSWINEEMAKMVSHKFYREISRCMGIPQNESDLINNQFGLEFEDGMKELILKSPDAESIIKVNKSTQIETMRYDILDGTKNSEDVLAKFFLEQASESIFHSDRAEAFYLPAARTGIMQSHRAIAGALVQRATFAGLETVSVPTLSGIVSDFLEEIILMDTSIIGNEKVEQVAQQMEKRILHGSIKAEVSKTDQYPRFLYKQNGLEVPLLRSSSMVSELAPVVLYIRHRVDKGDLLIIEEPESHLHPDAQRGIAYTVAQLVRAGVRVIVTTHSDYFLEQIGNCVRSSQLDKPEIPPIWENEISAYSFEIQNKGGTIVKRLNYNKEGGLSPEDHAKVSSSLYNQTVDILDVIEGEK